MDRGRRYGHGQGKEVWAWTGEEGMVMGRGRNLTLIDKGDIPPCHPWQVHEEGGYGHKKAT